MFTKSRAAQASRLPQYPGATHLKVQELTQKKVTYICTDVYQPTSSHPSVGYDN